MDWASIFPRGKYTGPLALSLKVIVEPDETSAAVALGPEEAAVNVDDASPSEPMRDGAGEVLGWLATGGPLPAEVALELVLGAGAPVPPLVVAAPPVDAPPPVDAGWTVKLHVGGVGSMLPARSVARTLNV